MAKMMKTGSGSRRASQDHDAKLDTENGQA